MLSIQFHKVPIPFILLREAQYELLIVVDIRPYVYWKLFPKNIDDKTWNFDSFLHWFDIFQVLSLQLLLTHFHKVFLKFEF